jgi:hypothetical protein
MAAAAVALARIVDRCDQRLWSRKASKSDSSMKFICRPAVAKPVGKGMAASTSRSQPIIPVAGEEQMSLTSGARMLVGRCGRQLRVAMTAMTLASFGGAGSGGRTSGGGSGSGDRPSLVPSARRTRAVAGVAAAPSRVGHASARNGAVRCNLRLPLGGRAPSRRPRSEARTPSWSNGAARTAW